MKKYIYLLALMLSISISSFVRGQGIGLKMIANEKAFVDEKNGVKTVVRDGVVKGVSYSYVNNYTWTLAFFTLNHNMTISEYKLSDSTIFQSVMDLVPVSDGYLVTIIGTNMITPKSAFKIPVLVKIDLNGNFLWKKTYKDLQFYVNTETGEGTVGVSFKAIEVSGSYTLHFADQIFTVDAKGDVLNQFDLGEGINVIDFKNFSQGTFLSCRRDSSINGSWYSYYYNFYFLDFSKQQGVGSLDFNSIVKWQYKLTLDCNEKNIFISGKVFSREIAPDSFEVLVYQHAGSEVGKVLVFTMSSSGIQKTEVTVPFLGYSINHEIGYSDLGNYYFMTSSGHIGLTYNNVRVMTSKTLLDTIGILNQSIDETDNVTNSNISELPDGSFYSYTPLSSSGQYFWSFRRIARTPFPTTNVVANWNGTVYWDDPNLTGGSPIDSFEVWYQPGESTAWVIEQVANVNSYIIPDLKSNTTYLVKVRAHNEAGWGEFSPEATFTTQNTGVNQISRNTLTLYPNPVASGETITINNVTGGILYIFSLSSKLIFKEDLSSNQIKLPDLSNGVYVISVYTDNIQYQDKLIVK